ncbi:Sec-independent protein translocase protein TatB [Candidatus Nitrotoga sp. M5]|uniref:Sec-independent protein translocase protein TatB n=1 Tax=Candidatus Nitrotoga sp. M5 TaxID=2890409 RepID=UPI001EF7123E|nr:Sec-independent protein translocase protein TatB [Candidatus Nitrotoga sp. M5]CAH1387597.1 Sec-independent protein translocase protein TatB [Candidatus Nitrotoga sp. M5]
MFDVDFSEIMVITAVAFIVIGPERLPKVARTLGHLLGRGQRYISAVKSDIVRDIGIEEMRQLQEKVQSEYKIAADAVNEVTQSLNQHAQEVTQSLNQQVEQAKESVNQEFQLNSEVQSTVKPVTLEKQSTSKPSENDKSAPQLSKQNIGKIEGSVPASSESSTEEDEFKTVASAYQEATRNLYAQQEAARKLHIQEEKQRQQKQNEDQQVSNNNQTVPLDKLDKQNTSKPTESDKGAPQLSKQNIGNIEGSALASSGSSTKEDEFKTISSAYQEATRNLYAQQEAARNSHIQKEKLRQQEKIKNQQVSNNDQTVPQDQLVQQPNSGKIPPKQAGVQHDAQPELQITPEQTRFPID